MKALQILYVISMIVWFLSEFLYKNMLKSGKDDRKGMDKSTLNILWLAIPFSIAAAVTISNLSTLPITHYPWKLDFVSGRSMYPYRDYFQVYHHKILGEIFYSGCYY